MARHRKHSKNEFNEISHARDIPEDVFALIEHEVKIHPALRPLFSEDEKSERTFYYLPRYSGESVVGAAICHVEPLSKESVQGFIDIVYVASDSRGSRVGTELLEHSFLLLLEELSASVITYESEYKHREFLDSYGLLPTSESRSSTLGLEPRRLHKFVLA